MSIAVGGARAGDDHQARGVAGIGGVGAFGGDEVVGLIDRLEGDLVGEDVRELGEEAGDFAQTLLPGGAVDDQRRRGRKQAGLEADLGRLGGEVGGIVFLLARTCCSVLTLRKPSRRARSRGWWRTRASGRWRWDRR